MMIGLIAKLKVQEGKGPEFETAFKPLSDIVNSDVEPAMCSTSCARAGQTRTPMW
jgi:hypothetical protein